MRDDIAFIWRAARNVGIVAVMRVDSVPYDFEELPLEKEYYKRIGNEKPDIGERLRVEGIFLGRCRLIRSNDIRKNKSLKISALTNQMGTNFELTEKQGKILMSLFEKRKDKMVYTAGN